MRVLVRLFFGGQFYVCTPLGLRFASGLNRLGNVALWRQSG